MQLAPQINIIRSIHRQDDSYVSKINEIYGELCGVEMYYPDFQKWFFYKVLPIEEDQQKFENMCQKSVFTGMEGEKYIFKWQF